MGDIKKIRKKYETPMHPWVGSRIEEERGLLKEYGLRNKKEVWKMNSTVTRFKDRAKRLLAQQGTQADREREQMFARTARLGLLKQGAGFDEILGLAVKDVLDRRLDTLLVKRHLARTAKQARQMVTHRHVVVGEKMITSPGYLVSVDEEQLIGFAPSSGFFNEQHPERLSEEELAAKQAKGEKRKAEKTDAEEALTFDEKSIEEAEVLAGEKKKAEKPVHEKKTEHKAEKKDEPKAEPEAKKEADA